MNNLTRIERKELEALSKEVFGSTSRYKSILNHGTVEAVTQTRVEEVPSEDPSVPATTKEVQVPVLTSNGVKQTYVKYYSVDEIKALMLKLKTQKDEFMEQMAKRMEEQKLQKEKEDLVKKIQEDLAGSANLR